MEYVEMIIKKIVSKIELMLLILILIASAICIINSKIYEIIQIAINVAIISYFIVRIIRRKPIKIIQSKMDVFALLLSISTCIPLIFNTYISLELTVKAILTYITLFGIYILVREICKKDKKNIQVITSVIIGITIFFIFLGLDNLTTNNILGFLNVNDIINGESRLVSLFGNPNALAGIIVFSYFISLDKTIKSKDITKNIFSVINTILILGLAMTYSKLMFIIFAFMLVIYMFLLKDKTKNIYIMQNLIISSIMAVIYIYVFQNLITQEEFMLIFIFSMFWLLMAVLFNILNGKTTKYLEKIRLRTILILLILGSVILGVFIHIELRNTKEFVVFSKNSSANYNSKKIKNVKPNEKYIFDFDMDAKMDLVRNSDENDIFTINIIQRDPKNIEITNKEVQFGNFTGVKEIEVETTENTSEIKIEFKSKYSFTPKQWIINNLKINGEEVVLEYAHLPTKLVEKISDININYKTAQERFQFIKDGAKLISQNFLTGIGGGGWQFKYKEVQDYGYISNDPHSYFTQVWLEYGLLGIISLVAIIFIIIKNKDEELRGVKFAIMTLLMHSMLDSDMHYFYVEILVFLAMGILSIKNYEIEKYNKKTYVTNGILIIIFIIATYLYFNPRIYNQFTIIDGINRKQVGLRTNSQEYKDISYELYEAYDNAMKYERDLSSRYQYQESKIKAYINSDKADLDKIIESYYNDIIKYKNKCLYDNKIIIEKSEEIYDIIKMLEEKNDPKLYPWMVKLSEININEFEETKKQLENSIQKTYEKKEENMEYNSLIDINEYCKQIYKGYCLGISINNWSDIDILQYIDDDDDDIQIDNTNVLIYHTHTTEGYETGKENHKEIEEGKTLNEKYNVINIGEKLKESLVSKGFDVTHLKDYHDKEGINGAYERSMNTVKNFLKKQNKKIDIIFDVHRDAYMGGPLDENYVEIDGKKAAKLRFVIAVGNSGWKNNIKWAMKIQKKADELYPNLFESMFIYNNNYNQSISKYATLIEVGNNENTVEEAQRSMEYLSEVLKELCIK